MFDVQTTKKKFNANNVTFGGKYRYIARGEKNNGIKGYITEDIQYLNDANTISFGQDTATMFYQDEPYFTGDKIKVFYPRKDIKLNRSTSQLFITAMQKSFASFSWGSSSYNVNILNAMKIQLPIKNGEINFSFMEKFIAELEAERIAELEAYLVATNLKDYTLSKEEKKVLEDFENGDFEFDEFTLEELFGASTRGKRLKSADRVQGTLPFVTAGEANEGISALVGNDIDVFEKNTITIDMFGSAKYRNYVYGGDDHIAVVHTENIPKLSSIFVTSAIHKSSHAGQFDYSRNFYAKDADMLNISLPIKNKKPNYQLMETFISAIQKLVIKDVVLYADEKISATKRVVDEK